jgi:SAM-dependent methyltransferase
MSTPTPPPTTSRPDPRDLAATRQFFATKASTWEDRFPDDEPLYRQAVEALDPGPGSIALDAGCGTGRALPALRDAVGPTGLVVGLDVTPEMLDEAARRGRDRSATLVNADASCLPLSSGTVNAIFAAGLVHHLADTDAGLTELARVTARGGHLAIFHPIGRAALAARHGHQPSDDHPLAESNLRALLRRTGWLPLTIDDAENRYLALATRA